MTVKYRSNNLQYCTKSLSTRAKHAIQQPLSLNKEPQVLNSKGSFFKHKAKRKKITRQIKAGHNSFKFALHSFSNHNTN